MGSHEILMAVYEIHRLADPNQPRHPELLRARLLEIFALACAVMEATGFYPDRLPPVEA